MKNSKAFTLLELLVVIGIIALLVAVGTISYSSAQQRARDSRRRSDMEGLSRALEQYYAVNNGSYPTDTDCAGYETYLAGSAPVDPKTGAYDLANSCAADGTAYCLCATMEGTNTGNAYGRANSTCTWSGAGDKDYFCVQNQQ